MIAKALISSVLVLLFSWIVPAVHAQEGGATYAGGLDSPTDGQVVDQGFRVSGWGADPRVPTGSGTGIDRVVIFVDRTGEDAQPVGSATIEARPDVAAANGRPDWGMSGFSYTLPALSPGPDQVCVVPLSSISGERLAMNCVRVELRAAATTANQPAGASAASTTSSSTSARPACGTYFDYETADLRNIGESANCDWVPYNSSGDLLPNGRYNVTVTRFEPNVYREDSTGLLIQTRLCGEPAAGSAARLAWSGVAVRSTADTTLYRGESSMSLVSGGSAPCDVVGIRSASTTTTARPACGTFFDYDTNTVRTLSEATNCDWVAYNGSSDVLPNGRYLVSVTRLETNLYREDTSGLLIQTRSCSEFASAAPAQLIWNGVAIRTTSGSTISRPSSSMSVLAGGSAPCDVVSIRSARS